MSSLTVPPTPTDQVSDTDKPPDLYIEAYSHPVLGNGVRACRDIKENTVIIRIDLSKATYTEKTKYTIHVGNDRHILDTGIIKWLNHSCSPTVRFSVSDSATLELITTRALTKGEDIVFDYETTEEEMIEPFFCKCGSAQCKGLIRGNKFRNSELDEISDSSLSSWDTSPTPWFLSDENKPGQLKIDKWF
jgi:hypothetical protein